MLAMMAWGILSFVSEDKLQKSPKRSPIKMEGAGKELMFQSAPRNLTGEMPSGMVDDAAGRGT